MNQVGQIHLGGNKNETLHNSNQKVPH
jgi:hypothetical protein